MNPGGGVPRPLLYEKACGMKPENQLERKLEALARSEIRSVESQHRLRRARGAALQQTATRDGLGFLMAFVWVIFAGFGARLLTRSPGGPSNPNSATRSTGGES